MLTADEEARRLREGEDPPLGGDPVDELAGALVTGMAYAPGEEMLREGESVPESSLPNATADGCSAFGLYMRAVSLRKQIRDFLSSLPMRGQGGDPQELIEAWETYKEVAHGHN